MGEHASGPFTQHIDTAEKRTDMQGSIGSPVMAEDCKGLLEPYVHCLLGVATVTILSDSLGESFRSA